MIALETNENASTCNPYRSKIAVIEGSIIRYYNSFLDKKIGEKTIITVVVY
jgi:hypothetical protein